MRKRVMIALDGCTALILMVLVFQACSSGPPAPRPPAHIRQSTFYVNEGVKLFNKGCYTDAMDYFQNAHQRFTAADDLNGVAQSLNNIADIYYRLEDWQSALLVYDEAVAVLQQLSNYDGLVRALSNKAAVLIELERTEAAGRILDQADAMAEKDMHAVLRLKIKALLALQNNSVEAAHDLILQALSAATPTDQALISSIYYTLGHIQMRKDQLDMAQSQFAKALAMDRTNGAFYDIARDLAAIGHCHARQGHHEQAVDYLKRSAQIFALLQRPEKAELVVTQLKESAAHTDVPVAAALHWVAEWLANPGRISLCD